MTLYERLHGKKPEDEKSSQLAKDKKPSLENVHGEYPPLVRDKLLSAFYKESLEEFEDVKKNKRNEQVEIIKAKVNSILPKTLNYPLTKIQKINLIQDVADEITGLGQLEKLIREEVEGIFIQSYNLIYIQKEGKWEESKVKFILEEHLLSNLEKILTTIDKAIVEGKFTSLMGLGAMKFIPLTVCYTLTTFVSKGLIGKSTVAFIMSQDLFPPEEFSNNLNVDESTTLNLGVYLMLRENND